MQQLACQRLGLLLLVLALGSALASADGVKQWDKSSLDASRHRRSLLAATQQISQCDWIAGEGCALHPAYASYALNKSSDDVVAQYVANALACATATDKGLCDSASYCYWDPSFTNGQQGCFLQDDALLSLQLRCVQQQYHPSLSKLQACMAARQSCQCSGSTTASSTPSTVSCTQRQQQLQASFPGSSRGKVCSSLLGCWLSSLNNTSTDLTALVEAHLAVVQPKIESLSAAGSEPQAGGRRRALLQIPPSLSDPVLDDKSGTSAGGSLEAGSYGPGSSSASGAAPSVGMNGVITDEQAAESVTTTTPVENGNNVLAPSKTNASSNSNSTLNLESGAVGGDWVLEQAPVNPDEIFSSSPAAGSSNGGSSDSSSVTMTGGNAPTSFWQCAGDAAAKADTARKWADIDYNSKTLTLATWLKVIQPTSLIDWGVQVLDCFKTEVPKLTNLDASTNSTKPNKESLEFAIVALIRSFTGQAEAFRAYLQAGATSRSAAGLSQLTKLASEVFPGQLAALTAKQQSAPAYKRDVMLQAAAVVTDMQWFAADVLNLASSGDAAAQQEAFEGYITYAEESMRRSLYWLFSLQFEGPPAHLPGTIPSSAASAAVTSAFESLAAAALPSRITAADAPEWQQLQVMTATAAGSAAAAAASYGTGFDNSQILSNTVAGLAKAHVQDLWGSRLELAQFAAPAAARQLALRDPNLKSARWEPMRKQQVAMLAALQQRAALSGADGGMANMRLAVALRELVAASGAYLLGSDSAAQQQVKQAELSSALGLAARVALLVRQCHGSPAGLPALSPAAAAKAGIPAADADACTELAAYTEQLAGVKQGSVVANTLLADIDRQWRCNAVPAGSCSSKPGCVLALAPVLVPSTAAVSADNMTLVCQASDVSLLITSLDSSSKSALAASPTCDQFLRLPACEAISNAASCSSSPTCRWETSAQRNILHTAASSPPKAPVAAGSRGVCAVDWVSVLSSTGGGNAYNMLSSMISLCSGIGDDGQCESQTMLITMDAPAPSSGSSLARIWVPALVVAGVAGVLLFGAAIWWRRRSAAARRAAEEARGAAGGGRGSRKGGKDGKGGKGAKGAKRKVKRAEPGEYKPDLMRDSFTDYMRAAPQQFNNGVAIAKAAMATGDLDTAVAVADVAGGRQLSAMQQQQHAGVPASPYGPGRTPSPGSEGSWGLAVGPAGSVPRSQGSSDLIDLSQSDASGHGALNSPAERSGPAYGSAASLQQQRGAGVAAGGSPPRVPGLVWGSAAAAAGVGLANSQQLVSPRGPGGFGQPSPTGGRPPLHGDMSVPMTLLDANASIALTSSINLVSSLPHHSSLPVGFVTGDQQLGMQQEGAGQLNPFAQQGMNTAGLAGPGRVIFGAGGGLGRISGSSSAYGNRSGNFDNAHSGSLLLPVTSRGVGAAPSEDGCITPTDSCCHDSVCTFGQGPGSVVSAAGSSGARPGGGLRPQGSQRGVAASRGSGAAGAGGLTAAPSVPLSRSSWSSAISTDFLMSTQASSAIVDP